jgi:iron-sulfur cluster assembly protein
MTITLTEQAANQVRKQLAKRGHGLGLRLGVRKSGCSGFAYVVDYADEVRPGDQIFKAHEVSVFIDEDSLPFLEGLRLDYVRQGINESFHFENPNVKESCGCGESFNI